MLKGRALKKALSVLCAVCMLFSMLASEAVAFASNDEAAAAEAVVGQSLGTQADEEMLHGGAPGETPESFRDAAEESDESIPYESGDVDEAAIAAGDEEPDEAGADDAAPAEETAGQPSGLAGEAAGETPAAEIAAAPVQAGGQFGPEAETFSLYTAGNASERAAGRGVREGTDSTDLADFLVSVDIDAAVDEQGNYIVNPNGAYEMTLKFSESENLQFADEETLIYDLPDGIVVGNVSPATFSIEVKDQDGTATVSGTFEVVDGQLRVRFNQDDPGFERLAAAANASFEITITSSYDQNYEEIQFAPGIVKEFVYDDSADVDITKSVEYDANTDTAHYVLQISSAGLNENVVIEDRLAGTALIFNRDVTIESNINGAVSAAPDYTGVENGFRVVIPQMTNREVLTLRYTATVDNDKITGTGTVAQTNNTARVTSDQTPDGKEVKADFRGEVTFHQLSKGKVGDPVLLDDGTCETAWRVQVNRDHKLTVGGKEIRDWVGTSSQPFMQFGGDGLTVQVTFEDGAAETREIPWSALTTTSNDKGIVGWSYTPPVSDGKAAYLITCKTVIDPTGALGDLRVTNYASFHGKEGSAETTVNVVADDGLFIRKETVGNTAAEAEWKITVTVPGTGLPDLRVVDDFPRVSYGGDVYYDGFVDGSMAVAGLLPGESWNLYVGSAGHSCTVTFYQDAGQTAGGILPTPDGQPREIEIRFKTTVNQDWLALAAEDGYDDYRLYAHFNHANARSLDYRTRDAEAYVVPIQPDFVKRFVERADVEIDGVTYPAFRYTLGLYGPLEDGVAIHDAFNTSYLRFYEGDGIQIFGGASLTPTDGDGTISAVGTADGMDILVSSFPKTGAGKFYPYYLIRYTLIVKDAETLAALNEAAALSQTGIDLENTARWGDLESGSEVTYSYFPYVDKELLGRPSADNGYVAEFKVIVNKYAEDLDPTSDVLAVRDTLSSNLRFLPDSLVISPAVDAIEVQYDADTNALTLLNIPDQTTFEITYRARVLGQGNVTYSNTIQFGKYKKTVAESTVVESSGGGSASNPGITLIKRDANSITATLAGATFQLYYLRGNDRVPVVDRTGSEVTFTTGPDGSVLISGNQQTLGWALWTGRTYCLVEISAPSGYELNQEPTYFVLSEAPVSQIEYDVTGDQLSIQNTPIRKSISVTKMWVGPAAESVTVNLLADGEVVDSAVLSVRDDWQHTFEGLPKYDNGKEIVYRLEELTLPGYSSEIIPNEDGSYTIVNTNTETINIPVIKRWVGEPASSVTVRLLADGALAGTVELSAAGDWQHTFTALPKYDSVDGHRIQYDVTEEDVAGYAQGRSGSVETGFTFTNTITGKTAVSVSKVWDDDNDRDGIRPQSVTVKLLADGADTGRTAELNAAGNWTASFSGLDEYREGQRILYTVEETAVAGYTAAVTGDAVTGYTITNTHEPDKRGVPVTKVWNDQNNTGRRPLSITIHLLANGRDTGKTLILNAGNGWAGSFTGLDKYKDGTRIVYSISEDAVSGYTTTIKGDMASGFTVTNTRRTTGSTTPPARFEAPETGDDSRMSLWLAMMLISGAGLICLGLAAKRKSRRRRS